MAHRFLCDFLHESGIISAEQAHTFEAELASTDTPVISFFEKRGIIKENDLGALLENHYKVAYISFNDLKVDKDVLKCIPEDIIRKNLIVPIAKQGNTLSIAMANPNNINAIEDVQIITGFSVKPFVTLEDNILRILDDFFSLDKMKRLITETTLDSINFPSLAHVTGTELKSDINIVKIVDTIFEEAVRASASDIHIEPQEKNIFIRFRIDGIIHTVDALPPELLPAIVSRIKIMSDLDISEKRLPQDGQIHIDLQKRAIDLRVSTLPGKYGEKLVIRVLDKSNFSIGIEHLGLLPENQTKFEELLTSRNGIILVTGPTGSGKSTTLYSAINRIKSVTKNIITLEDPVEYELLYGKNKECGITQVQINTKTGLTFPAALRACLRQDPDVILLGEIRDSETCTTAINAALMGHLVLSTLHTNDSISSITRLLDMGIEPFLISSSLIGILAQRLVRTLCIHCKEKYVPPKTLLTKLNIKTALDEEIVFFRPSGCAYCGNSGYKGRTAVFELLIIHERVRELILQKERYSVFLEEAKKSGMTTMKENGIQLVARGITTISELMREVPF